MRIVPMANSDCMVWEFDKVIGRKLKKVKKEFQILLLKMYGLGIRQGDRKEAEESKERISNSFVENVCEDLNKNGKCILHYAVRTLC